MSEPFTDYLVLDIIRCLVAPAAWILCALVTRLAVIRWRGRRGDPNRYGRTHPATMLSYAGLLLFLGVRRADQLGGPFDWYILPGIVFLVLGYIGVFRRVHVPYRWGRGISPRRDQS